MDFRVHIAQSALNYNKYYNNYNFFKYYNYNYNKYYNYNYYNLVKQI